MRYCLLILSMLLLLVCVGCHSQTDMPEAPPAEPDSMMPEEERGPGAPGETEAVFTTLDEPSLRDYYAQLDKELLYCQANPAGDFAVVAFEYAPNDFLVFECIDRYGRRDPFINAYWLESLEFSGADNFYVVGYFSVNGMSPPPTNFPEKISFYRDANGSWHRSNDLRYRAPLAKTYTIGKGAMAVLTGLHLTAYGLDLEFGPQKGYEGEFYAAYASLPVSEFRFDAEHSRGIITMQDTILGVAEGETLYDDPDGAIHSLRVYSENGCAKIELQLNELAGYYRWEWQEKLNFDPIACLRFYQWED